MLPDGLARAGARNARSQNQIFSVNHPKTPLLLSFGFSHMPNRSLYAMVPLG